MASYDIRPVSSELLDDYLRFFDDDAFTDNPDWGGCYCCYYHVGLPSEEWMKRTKAENRESAALFIRNETLKGYLAFQDGKVVGWCNANRRSAYPLLMMIPAFAEMAREFDDVRAIVCFLISPAFRGKGVATALLERVVEDARAEGCSFVEAYPFKGGKNCADEYHGPMKMYENAGFTVAMSLENLDVVRLAL